MKDEIQLTKEILDTLNEDDLLLITYPGRMGDIDGCSFAIKSNNGVDIYRIDEFYKFDGDLPRFLYRTPVPRGSVPPEGSFQFRG